MPSDAPENSPARSSDDATALACAREPEPAGEGCLTVLYDGACPLCRREIALYQGLNATQPVAYVDVSDPQAALPPGKDRAALLARFHVVRADGTVTDGARGFVALWAALPGWRWLARLAAWPGVTPLMEGAYRAFLRLRPAMQHGARWLERRAARSRAVQP